MSSLARRRLVNQRLVNQRLVSPPRASAEDVVRALGAVQSQDYANAKWALARRATGLTDTDVESAVASGAILRTHVLRPTWHFVLPEDVRWMLALTAPRIAVNVAYHNKTLGLDAKIFRRSNRALERALRDGKQLTRGELAKALQRAGVDVSTGQHVGRLLMQAELDGVLISGARRGKQFSYALFDDRVPAAATRDRDDGSRELARRYFATRGPATLHDFAWWSGLTVADAKRGVEANDTFLARQIIGERAYWHAPSTAVETRVPKMAHLLPNYDELFVGFKDRSAFSDRLRLRTSGPRIDALMGHMLFVDGQIVGGWRRTLGDRADIGLRLLVSLTAAERKLVEREVERFGEFLGLPVRLRLTR